MFPGNTGAARLQSWTCNCVMRAGAEPKLSVLFLSTDRSSDRRGSLARREKKKKKSIEDLLQDWLTYCYGLNCVPLKKISWSPKSQCLRMWSHLEVGSLQRRSSKNEIIRADLNSRWLVNFIKNRIWTQRQMQTKGQWHTDTEGEDSYVTSISQGMTRIAGNSKSYTRQKQILPESHRKEHSSANTLFCTSSLQDCDIINVSCFEPPRLQCFVTVALGS